MVALAWAAALFGSVWQQSGGHFMLPLDDAYIHLQYAKMAAKAQPLAYTTGAAPSGGATSPLWVLSLVPAFLIGLLGVKGALAAFLLGVPLFAAGAFLCHRLTTALTGHSGLGYLALALFALNGHAAWAFFSGMETGLFTVLLLGVFAGQAAWFGEERRGGLVFSIACAALLPLARPEGAGIVLLLILLSLFRRRGPTPLSPLGYLPGLALFAIWIVLLGLATGTWKPSGAATKGLFSDPETTPWIALRLVGQNLAAIATDFFANRIPDPAYTAFKGNPVMPYVALGLGFLAVFGGGSAIITDWRTRRPSLPSLMAILWLAGLLSVTASRYPFIHHQRYLVPWSVLAIPLAMLGIRRISALFGQNDGPAAGALGLLLAATALPAVPWWAAEFGRNGRDLFHQHRVLSFALEGLPRDQILAVSDTGILIYYSDLPHADVIGLTSSEFTPVAALGEGAILERLSSLPQQPTRMATYDEWWSEGFPLGDVLTAAAIADNSITSGAVLTLRLLPAYSPADAPSTPGLRVNWELDHLDPASEAVADYRYDLDPQDRRYDVWPSPNRPARTYLVDDDGSTVTLPVAVSEGARWVRSEEFRIPATAIVGLSSPTLHLRIARDAEDIEPGRISSRTLVLSYLSENRQGRAWQDLPLSLQGDGWLGAAVPLSSLGFERGQTGGEGSGGPLRIRLRSADPRFPGWYGARYWIEGPAAAP